MSISVFGTAAFLFSSEYFFCRLTTTGTKRFPFDKEFAAIITFNETLILILMFVYHTLHPLLLSSLVKPCMMAPPWKAV